MGWDRVRRGKETGRDNEKEEKEARGEGERTE